MIGPLVDTAAGDSMMKALDTLEQQGGELLYGGKKLAGEQYPGG